MSTVSEVAHLWSYLRIRSHLQGWWQAVNLQCCSTTNMSNSVGFYAFLVCFRLCSYNWQIQKRCCTDLPIESHSRQEVGQRIFKGYRIRLVPLPKDPPNLKPARLVKAALRYQGNSAYIIIIINYSLLMPILQPFQSLMYQYHISLHHWFRYSSNS